MAGRKKMSVEAILAKGNKSHLTKEEIEERKSKEEKLSKLASDKIKPPAWLSPRAKKMFKDTVKELEAIQLLANIDNYNLAILADAMDKYIKCTIDLHNADYVETYINNKGGESKQKNPLITVQIDYGNLVRKISNDFGLTPSARLKIIDDNTPELSEEDKDVEDEFESL
jgi:P27 family predicted phage terminase small subunit